MIKATTNGIKATTAGVALLALLGCAVEPHDGSPEPVTGQ